MIHYNYKILYPIKNLEIDYINGNNNPGIAKIKIEGDKIYFKSPGEDYGEPTTIQLNYYINVYSSSTNKYIKVYINDFVYPGELIFQIFPLYNNIFSDFIDATTIKNTEIILNNINDLSTCTFNPTSDNNIKLEYSLDNTTWYDNEQTLNINNGDNTVYLKITKLLNDGSPKVYFKLNNSIENHGGYIRIKNTDDVGFYITLNDGLEVKYASLGDFENDSYVEGLNNLYIKYLNEWGLITERNYEFYINDLNEVYTKPTPLSFLSVENLPGKILLKSIYNSTDYKLKIIIKNTLNDEVYNETHDLTTRNFNIEILHDLYHNEEIKIYTYIIINNIESDGFIKEHIIKNIEYRNAKFNYIYNNNIGQPSTDKSNYQDGNIILNEGCNFYINNTDKISKLYIDEEIILASAENNIYINNDWALVVPEVEFDEQNINRYVWDQCLNVKIFIQGELSAIFDFQNKIIYANSFKFENKYEQQYIPQPWLDAADSIYISNGEESYILIKQEGIYFYNTIDDTLNNTQLGEL